MERSQQLRTYSKGIHKDNDAPSAHAKLTSSLSLAHQAGIGVSPLGFPPITSFEHVELLEGHWLELRACRLVLVHVHDSMVCKIEMNSTTKRAHSFPLLVLDESIVYSTALGTALAGPTYGNGMVKMHMSLWSDRQEWPKQIREVAGSRSSSR